MKEYTQQEQVNIVRSAMILTEAIQLTQQELSKQSSAQFKRCPERPFRQVVPIQHIEPPRAARTEPNFREYWQGHPGMIVVWILASLLLGPFGIIGFLAWRSQLAKDLQTECDAQYNRYLQSDDYREQIRQYEAQVRAAEAVAATRQAQVDAEYEHALEVYNTATLPEYEAEKAQWEANKSATLKFLEAEICESTSELDKLYEDSKLISIHYRNADILKWLYLDMSTSDHDIRYATELLDRDRQRAQTANTNEIIQSEISKLRSALSSDLQSVKSAIMCGNELLLYMDSELGRIRNGTMVAAIGAGVAGYKALKS